MTLIFSEMKVTQMQCIEEGIRMEVKFVSYILKPSFSFDFHVGGKIFLEFSMLRYKISVQTLEPFLQMVVFSWEKKIVEIFLQ